MKRKLAASVSVAAAAVGTSVALCPTASADLDPCTMGTSSAMQYYESHGIPPSQWFQGCGATPPDAVPVAAPGIQPGVVGIPPAPIPPVSDPTVLADGSPNCAYYSDQVAHMPAGVDLLQYIAGLVPGGSTISHLDAATVVGVCGLANSVIGGVRGLEGDWPGMLENGQQATIGICNGFKGGIPVVGNMLPSC